MTLGTDTVLICYTAQKRVAETDFDGKELPREGGHPKLLAYQ